LAQAYREVEQAAAKGPDGIGIDEPVPADPLEAPGCGDVPNRRPAHAGEVAALVRYLAGETAEHITGQVINIDGGVSALLPRPR